MSLRRLIPMSGVLFVTISVFALAQPAKTDAASDRAFAIKFPGNQSCQSYVDAGEERGMEHAFFLGWLNGYVTSFNRHRAETVDVAPWQKLPLLSGLLLNYCRENPDKTFLVAVDAMIGALLPTRLRANSELVDIDTGDVPLQLYKAVLERAQQSLTELGYYSGGVDGVFGDSTKDAIQQFQQKKGIPTSGLPDQQTLYQLFN